MISLETVQVNLDQCNSYTVCSYRLINDEEFSEDKDLLLKVRYVDSITTVPQFY